MVCLLLCANVFHFSVERKPEVDIFMFTDISLLSYLQIIYIFDVFFSFHLAKLKHFKLPKTSLEALFKYASHKI